MHTRLHTHTHVHSCILRAEETSSINCVTSQCLQQLGPYESNATALQLCLIYLHRWQNPSSVHLSWRLVSRELDWRWWWRWTDTPIWNTRIPRSSLTRCTMLTILFQSLSVAGRSQLPTRSESQLFIQNAQCSLQLLNLVAIFQTETAQS